MPQELKQQIKQPKEEVPNAPEYIKDFHLSKQNEDELIGSLHDANLQKFIWLKTLSTIKNYKTGEGNAEFVLAELKAYVNLLPAIKPTQQKPPEVRSLDQVKALPKK